MNVKSKPIAVRGLVEALREHLLVIHDKDMLSELRQYCVLDLKEDGYVKYGAEEGFHDDRVTSLMIAVNQARDLPDERREDKMDQFTLQRNLTTGY